MQKSKQTKTIKNKRTDQQKQKTKNIRKTKHKTKPKINWRDFYQTYVLETWWAFYKKRELFPPRSAGFTTGFCWWVSVAHCFCFLCWFFNTLEGDFFSNKIN